MPTHLKNLVINEISSVDRGAGEGVRIMLMKRSGQAENTDLSPAVAKALEALRKSIVSIKADAAVVDKTAAIKESVEAFGKYLAGLSTEHQETEMTKEEIAKMVADSVTEAVTKASTTANEKIAKLEAELAFSKMSPEHQDFAKDMSPEDKAKFAAKSKDDRNADCEAKKKSNAGDPIVKGLQVENTDLKKRLEGLEEINKVAEFAKRAEDLGLPKVHGEVMRKAYSGDSDAIKKHEEMLKGIANQAKTGVIFKEFGSGNADATGVTPFQEMVAKGQELRKAIPTLTEAQAFAKAYTDPANAEIKERIQADEISKRRAA